MNFAMQKCDQANNKHVETRKYLQNQIRITKSKWGKTEKSYLVAKEILTLQKIKSLNSLNLIFNRFSFYLTYFTRPYLRYTIEISVTAILKLMFKNCLLADLSSPSPEVSLLKKTQ